MGPGYPGFETEFMTMFDHSRGDPTPLSKLRFHKKKTKRKKLKVLVIR